MEALMRLNATRAGHDKLVRSAQYACRFAYYTLLNISMKLFEGWSQHQNLVQQLKHAS